MVSDHPGECAEADPVARFATTHWSLVLTAATRDSPAALQALEQLCRTYWHPLYTFLRRNGYRPEDAKDLVQSFFVQILERDGLRRVERGHGRFRAYLLGALRHFLANEWDRQQAAKRGGGRTMVSLDGEDAERRYGLEIATTATPETLYQRAWALTVLETVQNRLRREYERRHQNPSRFDALYPLLANPGNHPTYAQVAARLGLAVGTVKAEVHRLRHRFRSLLRNEIARTVDSPADISDELRALMDAVRD